MSDNKPVENFGDWVNPMLVKELRQGLRSHVFIVTFLLVQVVLCFTILVAAGNDNPMSSASVAGNFIFGMFCVMALILQPVRAVTSLSSELKDGHMELVSLTQLSSWKTVWSKWCAVMLQSALIFIALLPFIMVRYFFGGLDLFIEAVKYALVLACSGVLVAGMVAISGIKVVILRGIFIASLSIIGFVLLRYLAMGRLFDFNVGDYAITDWTLWAFLGAVLLTVGYLIYLALTVAVRMIAPISENHSTMIRLITLGILILVSALFIFDPFLIYVEDWQQFVMVASLVAVLALIGLTEKGAELVSYLAVNKREKLPLFYWIIAPGWQFGFWIFSLGCLCYCAVIHFFSNLRDYHEMMAVFISCVTAAIFPRVVLPLFKKNVTFLSYIITLFVLAALIVACTIVAQLSLSSLFIGWLLIPIPCLSLPFFMESSRMNSVEEVYFYVLAGTFLFYWVVVAVMSLTSVRKELKEIKRVYG